VSSGNAGVVEEFGELRDSLGVEEESAGLEVTVPGEFVGGDGEEFSMAVDDGEEGGGESVLINGGVDSVKCLGEVVVDVGSQAKLVIENLEVNAGSELVATDLFDNARVFGRDGPGIGGRVAGAVGDALDEFGNGELAIVIGDVMINLEPVGVLDIGNNVLGEDVL